MTTQNGVIITRAEMRRRDSLIQWRPILAFRIGEWSNSISRSLPDPQSFPRKNTVIENQRSESMACVRLVAFLWRSCGMVTIPLPIPTRANQCR